MGCEDLKACGVIQDLLILYEDGACSQKSRELVEGHLRECPACAQYLEQIRHADEMLAPACTGEPAEEGRALKRSFRKIKRQWAISLLAVLMLFPIMGLVLLGVHEQKGQGTAFSNLDEIYQCVHYLKCIQRKDFERAVDCIDFSKMQYQSFDSVKNLTPEQFEAYMHRKIVDKLQEYDSLGIWIDHVGYSEAYRTGDGWSVEVSFVENYPDGSSQRVFVSFGGAPWELVSLRSVSGQMGATLYIAYILRLDIQEDPMGYCNYEAGFELAEGEKAVITWNGGKKILEDADMIMLVNTSFGSANHLDISRKRFAKGDALSISVPGKYALAAVDGEKTIDLTDYVDIQVSLIKNE